MIERALVLVNGFGRWLVSATCRHYWRLGGDELTVDGNVTSRYWCGDCDAEAIIILPDGPVGGVTVEQGRRGPIRWRVTASKLRREVL